MKKFITISLVLWSVIGSAMPPKPASCPKVGDLKRAGFAMTEKYDNGFSAIQVATYNTNEQWLFIVMDIPARSSNEAMSKGFKILDVVEGNPEPVAIEAVGIWSCLYHSSLGSDELYYAVAFTPLTISKTAALAKQFIL